MTEETKDKAPESVTPEELVAPEEEAFRARVEAFLSAFKKGLQNVLVNLIKGGMETLKHYIEDPKEKEVSWESPWVEARYKVEWDWERGGLNSLDPPDSVIEALRKGEDTRKLAVSFLSKAAPVWICPTVLQALTGQVAFHVKGGKMAGHFFLDPEVKDELDALPSEAERIVRMTELLKPFSIGGLEVMDQDGGVHILTPLDHEEAVPGTLPAWVEAIEKEAKTIPKITFKGEANGVPYQGSVVIMFHPLVVDEDRREAYFPIVTGLVFAPPETALSALGEEGSLRRGWPVINAEVDPSSWSEKDREDFWKALLADFMERLRKDLQETKEKVRDQERVRGQIQFFVPEEIEETAALTMTLEPMGVPSGAPSPERRYLLDAPTRIDRGAAVLVAHVGGLNLPRKWKDVKKWDELVKDEVERLQEAFGEKAFQGLRRETKDPNAHGRLLVKRTNAQGEMEITLSKEAEEALLETVGHKGFRRVVKDPDGLKREYLIKRFRAGSGYLEARLSWYGSAWPLVDEGREQRKKDLEDLKEQVRQGVLFDKLDTNVQEGLNARLRFMESIRDARVVMEAILAAFGAIGENPLRVPAWNFRTLLECEKDPDGFRRVLGCIRALQEVRYNIKAAKIPGLSQEAFGPFLGSVKFSRAGRGDHTDGDFYVTISPEFVGCLKVFQTVNYKIKEPHKVLYDWGKKLSKEEREELESGYLKGFSSLAPYYERARGFTPAQSNLRRWIEDNLTRNKDGTRKGSPSVRVSSNSRTADEPRLYGREFCPVLPEGRQFHGALAHFREGRGERGRTLYGTPTTPTKTSGAHKAGLLQVMGYTLPPGAAKAKRQGIARKALQDMRAVVEEAFGGMVVGYHESNWLSLRDAEKLPVDTLLKRVSWYLFLATDWQDRIPKEVEGYHAKRHARGETVYQVKVTKDRGLVKRAEAGRGLPAEAVGLDTEPLWIRLYIARKEKKLSQAAVGRIFGVSQGTANYWERGPDPGEDGKVHGKAIPADVAPLIVRWVKDGTVPTAEEMAVINARRKNRPGKKKETL